MAVSCVRDIAYPDTDPAKEPDDKWPKLELQTSGCGMQ